MSPSAGRPFSPRGAARGSGSQSIRNQSRWARESSSRRGILSASSNQRGLWLGEVRRGEAAGRPPRRQNRHREDLPRLRPQHLPEGGQEPGHRLAHQEGNQVPQGRLRRLGGRDPEEGLPLHRRLPGRPLQAGRIRRDQGESHSQPGLNRGDYYGGPRGEGHRHLWQADHPEVRHDQAGGGPPQAPGPYPG